MLSSAGQNCLPSDGIGAVSDQLAARLPTSSIRLNTAAAGVTSSSSGSGVTVSLADGNSIAARAVVVAVEGPEAARLLGPALQQSPSKAAPGVGTCCLYFKADAPSRWAAAKFGSCNGCPVPPAASLSACLARQLLPCSHAVLHLACPIRALSRAALDLYCLPGA